MEPQREGATVSRHQNLFRLSLSVTTLGAVLLGGCGPSGGLASEMAVPGQEGERVTAQANLPGLGLRRVTYEKIDGQAVLEGDILLDLRKDQTLSGQSVGRQNPSVRWLNG